jgi:hypothetical protein
VKPGFTAAKGELAADASPDGKRVFVVEVAGKGAFGDTFEVASGKRLARVPLTPPKDAGDKWSVAWVGKRVQVTAHRCCSPEGSSELVDPQSGASLGLGDVNALVKAKGDRFVVGTESEAAAKLAVVSDDGKLLKDLGPIAAKGYGEPELHVLDGVALPDGTAAIVHANPPGVVIVDVDALSVSADLPIPVCTW